MSEIAKALKAGIDIEKKGEVFYSKAAGEVENPHGQLTLNFLAREERAHYKFLEGLLASIKKGSARGRLALPVHPRLKKEEILETMRRMGVKGEVPRGNKEIIAAAMKVEKKSIAFYEGFLSEVKGEDNRKIFRTMAGEEKKHLEWLEFIMDAMEIHGYWYDLEGYFALEGF
jgi:rubrerythrin